MLVIFFLFQELYKQAMHFTTLRCWKVNESQWTTCTQSATTLQVAAPNSSSNLSGCHLTGKLSKEALVTRNPLLCTFPSVFSHTSGGRCPFGGPAVPALSICWPTWSRQVNASPSSPPVSQRPQESAPPTTATRVVGHACLGSALRSQKFTPVAWRGSSILPNLSDHAWRRNGCPEMLLEKEQRLPKQPALCPQTHEILSPNNHQKF